MLNNALVSICIPCYNSASYLHDTLSCLLHQTHQAIEIIIIDDNSNDESLKIISEFAFYDNRIKFELTTKKGASSARNQAYSQSKGAYIIFFDADDWIPKNFIASQLATLKSDNEVVVAKWGRFEKNELSTIKTDEYQIERDLTFEEWIVAYWNNNSNMTCPGRILIPRNQIELSGLWDEDLTLNDDFPFYMRLFCNSSSIRFNKETLFHYRSGINGLSSKNDTLSNISFFQSIKRCVDVALEKFKHNKNVALACANLWQNFIYEVYPNQSDLLKSATKQIQLLGGSDYPFPAGGVTRILNYIIGWKIVSRLKHFKKYERKI
ncbi:glycosyltransferase family 2 protein [Pedobacter agri]|uniref:Glycosyltransferase family 2 protein n=1 Tax=Pedobacter agri TaxID=454586 RepID=A0A9X3D9R9_9SPHI|nr:glycosyltransferase family 2 protein [Pedobacter agri]MCX3263644.1 glycosyltransferase family 2 protein [Pedobacter agri]